MRVATIGAALLLASCQARNNSAVTRRDSLDFGITPRDSVDSLLLTPRVVTGPTVLVFWLPAADTFPPDDQAAVLDELNYSTERIAPTLTRHSITLVPTNAETVYVALPNQQRRAILLTGVDYPFGYLLVEPGTAERILAGVYAEDELLDELQVYFDLPPVADSALARPRVST